MEGIIMAGFYPFNPTLGQRLQTNANGVVVDASYIAHLVWSEEEAIVADIDSLKVATAVSADSTVTLVPTAQPVCARNITLTADGTAGSIKAVAAIVTGKNIDGETITETMPAFTVDTAGSVTGSKAFASVDKVDVPAMDGAGVTVSIGHGEKLGLPYLLPTNTVLFGSKGATREADAPTVAVSATAIESNTIDFNSALDGTEMHAYFVV